MCANQHTVQGTPDVELFTEPAFASRVAKWPLLSGRYTNSPSKAGCMRMFIMNLSLRLLPFGMVNCNQMPQSISGRLSVHRYECPLQMAGCIEGGLANE